jgi:putative sugar O-methyltransferase
MKKYIPVKIKIFLLKVQLFFQTLLRFLSLKSHNDYKLSNVKRSFNQRLDNNEYDEILLKRICDAYNKSKLVQSKSENIFSPSNEWLPIYENSLKDVISALKTYNYQKLHSIFANFYREDCSDGLVGSYDMRNRYFGNNISFLNKLQWANSAIHSFKVWSSRQITNEPISNLQSPNIGNPYGFYFNDQFVSCGLYQHFYASQIKRLLEKKANKSILELGGGFGGMAYFIIRDIPNCSYLDLDLPENIALTSFYLIKAFPQKNITLFGESDNLNEFKQGNKIFLMPSFVVKELNSDSIDLVFNSYSLAEMSKETIEFYMSEFERLISKSGYFYHLNHNSKSLVKSDDFGISLEKFCLLFKIKGEWNINGDEYEYLYTKY